MPNKSPWRQQGWLWRSFPGILWGCGEHWMSWRMRVKLSARSAYSAVTYGQTGFHSLQNVLYESILLLRSYILG